MEALNVSNGLGGYYCGYSIWDTPYWATGEHTGGLRLQISTSWASYSAAEQRRTLAHELEHFLGMDNLPGPGCAQSAAVMQPDFACATGSNPVSTLTATDYVPVASTGYGGHTKKACGF